MKKLAITLAGAALALTGTAASADSLTERGEAKLARMLDGRVAGEPRSCISAFDSNRIRVIEHVGIVYDNGGTIWVARATHPEVLGPWDVPIIERHTSQLCTSDLIRTVDRNGGNFTGVVFLEDFVPYTRQG